MARMIVAQLRRRAGRTAALLLGVLLATTGFTVLTGSTATSQLTVQGTVAAHARGAYDILVRPKGTRTALEEQRGLVRANFLAGLYGGITADQWHQIAALSGVEVAAPIAMLGYVATLAGQISVDVTDVVDPSRDTQLIRVHFTWRGDRGLTVAADPDPSIVYVTKRPVILPKVLPQENEPVLYDDGLYRPQNVCSPDSGTDPYELQPDGRKLPFCVNQDDPRARASTNVARLTPRGTFILDGVETPRLISRIAAPAAVLAAAIDPAAEARLVGLDKAVINGRYLAENEPATVGSDTAPLLLASAPYLDERADGRAERVDSPDLAGLTEAEVARVVAAAPSEIARPTPGGAVQDLYQQSMLRTDLDQGSVVAVLTQTVRAGPVDYDVAPDGTLRPRAANENAAAALQSTANGGSGPIPWLTTDTAQRATSISPRGSLGSALLGTPVGVFDRNRLTAVDALATPLETYTQASATGANQHSRDLLGGQPLLPTGNMGGYLATSPTVLMALSTLWHSGGDPDAISAIRVRVAGLTGFDPISRERVRLVAEDIAIATGLDVEVMLGASGQPQEIVLPAGRYGRPELALAELWSKKGVAAAIVYAVDRKSIILFGLILVVCLLFLANAAAAAVRDRRRELAVLACLGWSRRRIASLLLGEVALVGGLAGLTSAALAWPLGAVLDIDVSAGQAWLAVPVSLGLCLLAAAVPTLRASRAHPAAAIHRAAIPPGRFGGRRRRSVVGLSVANLRRTPGRTALGGFALAVGVAGLTLVLAVTWNFHGRVTGTLLGDAVSVHVRGVDALAVVATVLIGAFAVADVLYLNIRDRAGEFAALQATGWSDVALSRLVTYEAVGIGAIGAVFGAGGGLGAAAVFVGQASTGLLWTAAIAAGIGVVVAATAAAVPAALQRRLPMSILLAEE